MSQALGVKATMEQRPERRRSPRAVVPTVSARGLILCALIGCVALSSAACRSGSVTPPGAGCVVTSSSVIDAAGGELTSADGRVRVTIAADTFSRSTHLYLGDVSEPPGDLLAGPIVEICPGLDTLSPAAQISMLIDAAELGNTTLVSTVMGRWDEQEMVWQPALEQSTEELPDGFFLRRGSFDQFGIIAAAVLPPDSTGVVCSGADACVRHLDCAVAQPSCDGTARIKPSATCVDCQCVGVTERTDCADTDQLCIQGFCVEDHCAGAPCANGGTCTAR